METRHESNDPIAAMVRSRREEIEKYLWIESERVGHDIGLQRAEREWRRKHARAWRHWVRSQGLGQPIVELIWSQQDEIEKFKWIESERRGGDIGWERAVREWCRQHYEAWQFHNLHEPGRVPDVVAPRGRRRSMEPEHRAKLSASMKAWWETRKTTGR
jgi:hypothetical protein